MKGHLSIHLPPPSLTTTLTTSVHYVIIYIYLSQSIAIELPQLHISERVRLYLTVSMPKTINR